MALLNEEFLRSRGAREARLERKSAQTILRERQQLSGRQYDIFLSHSFHDAELVLGIKLFLEDLGLSVYVDWVDDPHLNRNEINRETADTLRRRMQACRSLLYAASDNATNSRWMPWELGYFDGLKQGKVAILPISKNASNSNYTGQEYLNLYPRFEVEQVPEGARLVRKGAGIITSYPDVIQFWIDQTRHPQSSKNYRLFS